MRILVLFAALFCLSIWLSSCETPPDENVSVRLTMKQRDYVDRTVSAYMDSILPILNKRCEENFDRQVAIKADSIVQSRLEDEIRLRARISKPEQNE